MKQSIKAGYRYWKRTCAKTVAQHMTQ